MALFKKYYSTKQLQILVAVWLILLLPLTVRAQFAPPAGQEGTTAIKADSSIFVAWASNCVAEQGLMDISNPDLGNASFGSDSLAKGISDNSVVSLGDGGNAVLTFKTPIVNGSGADFAVFENSFLDNFLELAFVEVSSNGFNFTRFESTSNTQTDEQVTTFGSLDATQINNLAGKYRGGYGTPFDLEELKNTPNLDVNNIRAIRIIDVVGSIDEDYATYDSNENPINDPWPTPFESSGFDLDAIGVIHDKEHTAIGESDLVDLNVYPNPFSKHLNLYGLPENSTISIFDLTGRLVFSKLSIKHKSIIIDGNDLPGGMLFVRLSNESFSTTIKILHN